MTTIKDRLLELTKQYDHDYNDVFKINEDKITKAQMDIVNLCGNFAILKVAYTRNELHYILTGEKI